MNASSDRGTNRHISAQNMAAWLEARLGPDHALTRLDRERRLEAVRRQRGLRERMSLHHIVDSLVPGALRASGISVRGRTNATRIEVVRNQVVLAGLPAAFDGFTILHLSDLHADISEGAMQALPAAISGLQYDACVMTGDYRGKMVGPYDRALDLIDGVLPGINKPIYGVLGNHDPAAMLPGLEAMGIRMLMNESEPVVRGSGRLWFAGVDDPHFYRTDDLRKAMAAVPAGEKIVLLSHSTDGYERAATAAVDLMLSGHTHGGQICLPGGRPIMTSSKTPRHMATGRWRHREMFGYTSRGVGTSVIDARFNCAPEVALHTLRAR